jgi:hypothetical protein
MKTIQLMTIVLIGALLFFAGCKSSKKTTTFQKENNAVEITLPFTGAEYSSNKDVFRARQSGTSPDLPTSKKIALQNAKAEIASDIESVIKRTTDQYTTQRTIATKQEFKNKFEELSREVVKQNVVDATTIAEKVFKDKEGSYTYWVVVEVPKTSVLEGLNNKISKDQNLQLDFEKSQYEKTFNAEMEKFEKEQNK